METRVMIQPDLTRFRGVRTPDGTMLVMLSPDGEQHIVDDAEYDWGDRGEWYGRRHLAEDLMLYALGGERVSVTNCEKVAREIIAALPEDRWELSANEVKGWFAGMRILAH
jgi:hypothetical protein